MDNKPLLQMLCNLGENSGFISPCCIATDSGLSNRTLYNPLLMSFAAIGSIEHNSEIKVRVICPRIGSSLILIKCALEYRFSITFKVPTSFRDDARITLKFLEDSNW